MTQRSPRRDYVKADSTWYDPAPPSGISSAPVIGYRDEGLVEQVLLMQMIVMEPRLIAEIRSSM